MGMIGRLRGDAAIYRGLAPDLAGEPKLSAVQQSSLQLPAFHGHSQELKAEGCELFR
jgi:hypothetical protein